MVDIRPLRERGRGHWLLAVGCWLLARRSIADPDEIAYSSASALSIPNRPSWCGWPAAAGGSRSASRTTKNETGLDHYQVRGHFWYCHIALSMAAAAFLTILRRGVQKRESQPLQES